jgi:elongator complex protein 1
VAIREVKEAGVASGAAVPAEQQPAAAAHSSAGSGSSASAAVAAEVAVTPEEAAAPADLSAAADAALRHLLLYADVDVLYRTALGLYDLALAFMVVGHTQKDPGEYLSELTDFGSQSQEDLRRYAIDMSLCRYDRALENLVAAGASHFDAALKLAVERGLLRQLLALTQQQQRQQPAQVGQAGCLTPGQRLVTVLTAYGDWMMSSRKAEDAAVAYTAAGRLDLALQAYK